MTEELFPDISEDTRKTAAAVFQLALAQKTLQSALQVLMRYLNTCEEKEFVDFYFRTRLEELKNDVPAD